MPTSISNKQVLSGFTGQVKRLVGLRLMQRMYIHLRDYHRSQNMLSSSYQSSRIAKGMPMRIWKRHSALFMSINDKTDGY